MNYAIIKDGKVDNVIFVVNAQSLESLKAIFPGADLVLVEEGTLVEPGMSYDGAVFSASPPSPEQLEAARRAAFEAINARTNELIAEGYEYPPGSGNRYSLDAEARATRTALYVTAEDPAASWPLFWPTQDYKSGILLTDAASAKSFVVAGLWAYRNIISRDASEKALLAANGESHE